MARVDGARIVTLFQHLNERAYVGGLRRVRARYRFEVDVAGEGRSTWMVEVDGGYVRAYRGESDAACVIRCDAEDLVLIAHGELNLLAAHLQGRVQVTGDAVLAQKLASALPGPPIGEDARHG